MLRLLTIITASLALTGCDGLLNKIEGKESPYKADHDRRALLTTPAASQCHEVFRVTRCVDGVAVDWVM